MSDREYKWVPKGMRADGCQERIDMITGMAQTINLGTGKIENYKLVCPRCGKIIQRDDQGRSWSYRVYAKERYVHRCVVKGQTKLCDFTTLDMVVPPGMTIDQFYECVRYGLKHKEEVLNEAKRVDMDAEGNGEFQFTFYEV